MRRKEGRKGGNGGGEGGTEGGTFHSSATNSTSLKSSLKAVPWLDGSGQINILFLVSMCSMRCVLLLMYNMSGYKCKH